MKTALSIAMVVFAACGGAATGAKSPDESDARNRQMDHIGGDHQMGHGHAGEMGKHDEETMPPQLARFHDALAPRWHAAPGPQRMADACAAIPEFHHDAEAIAGAAPPSKGDASAWSRGGKQLTAAVAALDATCKNKDAEAFEPAFQRVHETFHGLLEAAGEHEKHEEPGGAKKAETPR